MISSSNTKNCEFCTKEISEAAIKCPYCQEWLNKREISFKNPVIRSVIWILIVFSAFTIIPKLVFMNQIEKYSREPKSYSKQTSKVFIKSHRLVKKKNSFSIIGEIDNKESFKWASISVLAVFKNKSGEVESLGSDYIQSVDKNSSKMFEINFGCSEEPYDADKFASYEIEIEEGRGEQH